MKTEAKPAENLSKSAQAAKTLEKEIFRGVYPAGTPLPGTRGLARHFGVSQRVVLSALDLLEKKDIVVRLERRRVFVKEREAAPGATEILFFAFGSELGVHSLYNAVNAIILNPPPERKFDFFSRIVSSGDILTPGRLDRELARLENLGFIDCAVFYAHMTEENMCKVLRLPYPVIFLGEVPDSGHLPDGARMISPNSDELVLTAAKHALAIHASELVFAYWALPAEHLYERNNLRALSDFAKRKELALRMIPVPGKDIGEVGKNFERMAPKLAESIPAGALLAAHNLHSDRFDSGELFPKARFHQLTLSIPRSFCGIPSVRRDYSELRSTLLSMIADCGKPLSGSRHVTVDYHYQVSYPEKLSERNCSR